MSEISNSEIHEDTSEIYDEGENSDNEPDFDFENNSEILCPLVENSESLIIDSNSDFEGDISELKSKSKLELKDRVTKPRLTKYERARILGARALQISNGSKILVDYKNETDALRIAQKELIERKLPIIIRRHLPNGFYEDWKVNELIF
jgi:DNA-directed RNA polymerase I, II, and III subunit RPABC2